jgi:hypothetical protein
MRLENLKKNMHNLDFLGHCSPKLRKIVLSQADGQLVLAICECMLNFLLGNVKINDRVLDKLQKHKQNIRLLVDKGKTIKQKKDLLVQKGGFLLLIIPAVLEIVTNLLKS